MHGKVSSTCEFTIIVIIIIGILITPHPHPTPLPPDNRVCYGETPIEQSEFCHYDHRDICGPLALQIIEHRNITPSHGTGEEDLCVCRYRGGKFVCDRGMAAGILNVDVCVLVSIQGQSYPVQYIYAHSIIYSASTWLLYCTLNFI